MKISGKFLKVLIPYKIYKLIANGFIVVPKYYKEILTQYCVKLIFNRL